MLPVSDKEGGDVVCVYITGEFVDTGVHDGFANKGECAVFFNMDFVPVV